jgi:lipopolysaccharide/colanic/teichoic acid biosynthesis glycosyltransferase
MYIPWRVRILAVDLLLLCVAGVIALLLRENLTIDIQKLKDIAPYVLFIVTLAVPVNLTFGLDRAVWRFAVFSDFMRIVLAVCLTVISATILTFLFNRMEGISRSLPIIQILISIFALVGVRLVVRAWFQAAPHEGSPPSLAPIETNMRAECVLIIGVNRLAVLLLKAMAELRGSEVRVVGLVALDGGSSGRTLSGFHVFGPEEDLSVILRSLSLHGVAVHRIVVTVSPELIPSRLRDSLLKTAEAMSIRVEHVTHVMNRLLPATAETRTTTSIAECERLERLRFNSEQISAIAGRSYWKLKRALDSTLAATMLVLLAPVLAALAVIVRLTLGSPIIFWQVRIGYFGRPFKLYKFRTMTDSYDKDGHLMDDRLRQNAIGRFMRASRLDELPQLWNILAGEMSFVGPRPLLPIDYLNGATVRCLVRPGLTGWAQVAGGRSVEAADKMALDIWYVRNASLGLDLKIMARTVPMVLFGEQICRDTIQRAWDDLRLATISAPADEQSSNEGERNAAAVNYQKGFARPKMPKRASIQVWDKKRKSSALN